MRMGNGGQVGRIQSTPSEVSILWRETVIWRVSALTGRQIVHAHIISLRSFTNPLLGCLSTKFECFRSAGVFFLLECCPFMSGDALHVYDDRCGQYQRYDTFWEQFRHSRRSKCFLISTTNRIFNASRKVKGWRIRFMESRLELAPNQHWKGCIRSSSVELRQGKVTLIGVEEIVFGNFAGPEILLKMEYVRSSEPGTFGLSVFDRNDVMHPLTMTFNVSTGRYKYWPTLMMLNLSGLRLLRFYDRPFPINDHEHPVFMNQRECIDVSNEGNVWRRKYSHSRTLKYMAAEIFVRANANPTLDGKQLRAITGVPL